MDRLTYRRSDGTIELMYPEHRIDGTEDRTVNLEHLIVKHLAYCEDIIEQGTYKEFPRKPKEVETKTEVKKGESCGVLTRQICACPRCNGGLFIQNTLEFADEWERRPEGAFFKYCSNCGQHIDWSEEKVCEMYKEE